MTTVRHVEKLWTARAWGRLLRELLAPRPENSPRLAEELHSLVATAALAMIRLDELNQTHTPLFGRLLKTVLASQERDGGWRDPATSALCLRALLVDGGHGPAIDAGLRYLAALQQDSGAWPREPLRRMPADAFTTALVLFHLGGLPGFGNVVRIEQAVDWLEDHADEFDAETRRLWSLTAMGCRGRGLGGGRGRGRARAVDPVPALWSRRCA